MVNTCCHQVLNVQQLLSRSGELGAYSGGLEYLDRFNPNAKPSLELSVNGTAHKGYGYVAV